MITKFFGLLIAAMWWLQIVVASAGVSLLLGLAIAHFVFAKHYLESALLFSLVGSIAGIFWAENVRTKIGLDKFFGTITGAPTKDQSMKRENY